MKTMNRRAFFKSLFALAASWQFLRCELPEIPEPPRDQPEGVLTLESLQQAMESLNARGDVSPSYFFATDRFADEWYEKTGSRTMYGRPFATETGIRQ